MKETIKAAERYVDDYMRWRTFGFKDSGAYNDQEAEYIDALEVCKIAWDVAEREAKEEANRNAAAQSKGKGRKRL